MPILMIAIIAFISLAYLLYHDTFYNFFGMIKIFTVKMVKALSTTQKALPTIRQSVYRFRPQWELGGNYKLKGGEVTNNAHLAHYIGKSTASYVNTEVTLPNGSRADILVNDRTVLECKPHLLSVDKLHSLSGEVRRIKRLGYYNLYAVIYGDAKLHFLNELQEDLPSNHVIVLGKIQSY